MRLNGRMLHLFSSIQSTANLCFQQWNSSIRAAMKRMSTRVYGVHANIVQLVNCVFDVFAAFAHRHVEGNRFDATRLRGNFNLIALGDHNWNYGSLLTNSIGTSTSAEEEWLTHPIITFHIIHLCERCLNCVSETRLASISVKNAIQLAHNVVPSSSHSLCCDSRISRAQLFPPHPPARTSAINKLSFRNQSLPVLFSPQSGIAGGNVDSLSISNAFEIGWHTVTLHSCIELGTRRSPALSYIPDQIRCHVVI